MHAHTHTSDKGIGMAVKNTLEIIIKQARLEGGFKRGGRIRVAECLRQIVPNRWACVRKRSFTKCFYLIWLKLNLYIWLISRLSCLDSPFHRPRYIIPASTHHEHGVYYVYTCAWMVSASTLSFCSAERVVLHKNDLLIFLLLAEWVDCYKLFDSHTFFLCISATKRRRRKQPEKNKKVYKPT